MSMEKHIFLGYGFFISEGAVPDELFDNFIESNYTYCLNTWQGKWNYFFGIKGNDVEPGAAIPLHKVSVCKDECDKMIEEFHKFFPTVEDEPESYLIHKVEDEPEFYLIYQVI